MLQAKHISKLEKFYVDGREQSLIFGIIIKNHYAKADYFNH